MYLQDLTCDVLRVSVVSVEVGLSMGSEDQFEWVLGSDLCQL